MKFQNLSRWVRLQEYANAQWKHGYVTALWDVVEHDPDLAATLKAGGALGADDLSLGCEELYHQYQELSLCLFRELREMLGRPGQRRTVVTGTITGIGPTPLVVDWHTPYSQTDAT